MQPLSLPHAGFRASPMFNRLIIRSISSVPGAFQVLCDPQHAKPPVRENGAETVRNK